MPSGETLRLQLLFTVYYAMMPMVLLDDSFLQEFVYLHGT